MRACFRREKLRQGSEFVSGDDLEASAIEAAEHNAEQRVGLYAGRVPLAKSGELTVAGLGAECLESKEWRVN